MGKFSPQRQQMKQAIEWIQSFSSYGAIAFRVATYGRPQYFPVYIVLARPLDEHWKRHTQLHINTSAEVVHAKKIREKAKLLSNSGLEIFMCQRRARRRVCCVGGLTTASAFKGRFYAIKVRSSQLHTRPYTWQIGSKSKIWITFHA